MTCLGPLKLLRHHPATDQATLTEFLHLNFACSAVLPKSHFSHSLCHGHGPEIFGCLSLNFLLVPCQSQNLYLKNIKMLVRVYYEIKFCGMLCCVTWQVVHSVSMEYSAFIFRVEQSKQTGLLYTEDEGITNHQKSVTTYH